MRPMSRFAQAVLLVGAALGAVLVWLTLQSLAVGPWSGAVDNLAAFTTIFLGIFIEAASFLLIGALASGLVEVFINQDDLNRFIPRDPVRGAIAGALLGFCFPVCECGVVPLSRRLLKKGLPLSVGVSFLLAAPVFNPIVIASTWAAFGFGRILILRLILTLAIAIVTGLVFSTQRRPEQLLRPSAWAVMGGASQSAPTLFQRPTLREGLGRAAVVAADEFVDMGRYLVFGALLAASLQTLIPQSALLTVSAGPVVSVLTMIALAVLLSICSTVDAFIALAFAGTFTSGSILAFLVFGPMVDIKSTLMFLGVFRRRAVLYLILLPLVMTILAAVIINLNFAW